jgi:hypothetical protein
VHPGCARREIDRWTVAIRCPVRAADCRKMYGLHALPSSITLSYTITAPNCHSYFDTHALPVSTTLPYRKATCSSTTPRCDTIAVAPCEKGRHASLRRKPTHKKTTLGTALPVPQNCFGGVGATPTSVRADPAPFPNPKPYPVGAETTPLPNPKPYPVRTETARLPNRFRHGALTAAPRRHCQRRVHSAIHPSPVPPPSAQAVAAATKSVRSRAARRRFRV